MLLIGLGHIIDSDAYGRVARRRVGSSIPATGEQR